MYKDGKIKNVLLRVGYSNYLDKVKDVSEQIKLDTFYPDGMMNA